MNTTQTDRLVDEYLRRLEAAAAHLQRSRRAELVAEIREHIETALRQEDAANEVAVRNVLERLGPPEEIVDAAEPPPAEPAGRAGKLEITALLALLVPVLGWLVGMVLVFVSEAWSRRDKLVAAGLLLLLLLLPAFAIVAESGGVDESVPVGSSGTPVTGDPGPAHQELSSSTDTEAMVVATLLGLLAGLPSALYLGWRLRRHPRRET
jgi:hypothetical protein